MLSRTGKIDGLLSMLSKLNKIKNASFFLSKGTRFSKSHSGNFPQTEQFGDTVSCRKPQERYVTPCSVSEYFLRLAELLSEVTTSTLAKYSVLLGNHFRLRLEMPIVYSGLFRTLGIIS